MDTAAEVAPLIMRELVPHSGEMAALYTTGVGELTPMSRT